jgi:hypothetical protein
MRTFGAAAELLLPGEDREMLITCPMSRLGCRALHRPGGWVLGEDDETRTLRSPAANHLAASGGLRSGNAGQAPAYRQFRVWSYPLSCLTAGYGAVKPMHGPLYASPSEQAHGSMAQDAKRRRAVRASDCLVHAPRITSRAVASSLHLVRVNVGLGRPLRRHARGGSARPGLPSSRTASTSVL